MRQLKTPWNPSKRAVKRVKNPLPEPEQCNCCGRLSVEIAHHKEVYGKAYSKWPWVFRCTYCFAYVGMHPFTNIPLGTLANAETRKARKECKEPFEKLFKSGRFTRSEAYELLAKKLGIPKEECHFGWFDIDMCNKAKVASREIFLGV